MRYQKSILILIISIILILTFIGYEMGYMIFYNEHKTITATVPKSTTTPVTITSFTNVYDLGNFTSTIGASYIIFEGDDGRIYAKDGQTGQIVATNNSDLSIVLQAVIDLIPSKQAGVIYIKPGIYKIYSTVRIADKSVALIGGWLWDISYIRRTQEYPATTLLLMKDNIIYFDIGDNTSSYPTHIVMIGFGVQASDANGNPVQHTSSIFVRMQNWVRHSLFRQLFINQVGEAFKHQQTYSPARGLEDVYFENIAVERVYDRAFNFLFTGYNVRFTDVYVGQNCIDDYIIAITNYYDVFISRLWFWTGNTTRGIILSGTQRAIISDSIIKGTINEVFRIEKANNIVIDNLIIDNVTYTTRSIFYLNNNTNLEIQNVYGKYATNAVYIESGSMPILINCRFFNVNTGIEYKSENSGTATIPAGQTRVTVTHFLLGTPNKVLVTPLGNARVWVENITSKSFDIVIDKAINENLNVYWYAGLLT